MSEPTKPVRPRPPTLEECGIEDIFSCKGKPWKLSHKPGSEVHFRDMKVLKFGYRIQKNQEITLRLVKQHTTIPVPEVLKTEYTDSGREPRGYLWMTPMSGMPLDEIWDDIDDATKERICKEVWGFLDQLRNIPKPSEFKDLFVCRSDGSSSREAFLREWITPSYPIRDDEDLRKRIYDNYVFSRGRKYQDTLFDLLPRSDRVVFSHCNVGPSDILVDESGKVSALLGWEHAGWFPEYFEYAHILRQWGDPEFMDFMKKTRPRDYDINFVHKTAKVLF